MTPTLFDGMERARQRAERESPGWTETAVAFLRAFAVVHGPFIVEEAVEASAQDPAFPPPPDARAWGGAVNAASRRGAITKTGRYRAAKSSNGSVKPEWRAA